MIQSFNEIEFHRITVRLRQFKIRVGRMKALGLSHTKEYEILKREHEQAKEDYLVMRKEKEAFDHMAKDPGCAQSAVFTWILRVHGIDLYKYKHEILRDPNVIEFLKSNISGVVTHTNGYKIVFKNKKAVTILEKD